MLLLLFDVSPLHCDYTHAYGMTILNSLMNVIIMEAQIPDSERTQHIGSMEMNVKFFCRRLNAAMCSSVVFAIFSVWNSCLLGSVMLFQCIHYYYSISIYYMEIATMKFQLNYI